MNTARLLFEIAREIARAMCDAFTMIQKHRCRGPQAVCQAFAESKRCMQESLELPVPPMHPTHPTPALAARRVF